MCIFVCLCMKTLMPSAKCKYVIMEFPDPVKQFFFVSRRTFFKFQILAYFRCIQQSSIIVLVKACLLHSVIVLSYYCQSSVTDSLTRYCLLILECKNILTLFALCLVLTPCQVYDVIKFHILSIDTSRCFTLAETMKVVKTAKIRNR